MRLHLLIDSNIKVNSLLDDIVLVSSYHDKSIVDCRVVSIDANIVNESPEIREIIRHQLEEYDDYYKNIANEAYVKFYRPIFMVLANVKKLVHDYCIDELILYEGSEYPFFLSEEAEGEGERNHYRTNWLVNAFIYNRYKDSIKISWNHKNSKLEMKWRNCYRHSTNVIKLLFFEVARSIFKSGNKETPKPTSNMIVSVISLSLQKGNLDTMMESINDVRHVYFSYNWGLVNNFNVFPVRVLSIRKLIRTIHSSYKFCHPTKMYIMGISVPSLIREFNYLVLKYSIYEERLKQTLKESKLLDSTVMLSNTTVGMDMVAIRNVTQQLGWRHINMQYVSMGRVLYPDLDLAEEYFLYARKTYSLYKQYSNRFKLYLPLSHKGNKKGDFTNSIVFSIFTQPDSFGKEYVHYLKQVLPEIDKITDDVKVVVKPHYRQDNVYELKEVIKDYNFVELADPNESCAGILKRTTIAMSINSSVIFEAMMVGIPTVVYNPGDKYHSTVYNNDFCFPEVNFVIEEPLQTLQILRNLAEYQEQFNERLNLFIESSGVEADIKNILGLT